MPVACALAEYDHSWAVQLVDRLALPATLTNCLSWVAVYVPHYVHLCAC